jgi:hypothetical protein
LNRIGQHKNIALGFFPQNMMHLQNERKRGTVAAPTDAASAFCSFHSLVAHPRGVSLRCKLSPPIVALPPVVPHASAAPPRPPSLPLLCRRTLAAPPPAISSSTASAWSASFPTASSAARQGAAKHAVDPLLGGALHMTTSGACVGSSAAGLDWGGGECRWRRSLAP